ncbi:unnamed protein product [Lota lota]
MKPQDESALLFLPLLSGFLLHQAESVKHAGELEKCSGNHSGNVSKALLLLGLQAFFIADLSLACATAKRPASERVKSLGADRLAPPQDQSQLMRSDTAGDCLSSGPDASPDRTANRRPALRKET